jgi:hypothetical protein
MRPIKTDACNATLGAPASWDTALGTCAPLHVHKDDSLLLVYSWWALTWRERISLLFGKSVRVCVVGRTMPPIALDVDSEREVAL